MFSKQYTPIKITVYGAFLVVCYLLQSVPALGFQFMSTSPELLLVLCICVAYNESETFSAFFGLAAGLLNDIITDNIVGKSAVLFMFAAFIISILLKTLLRTFFLTYIFTVLVTVISFLIIEYVFTCMFFEPIPFGLALLKIILPKFFFTGVIAYPLYFGVKFFKEKLWSGGEQSL